VAALIQLMAAAVAKREVCYFTFGDDNLTNGMDKVHQLLVREDKTVGTYCIELIPVSLTLHLQKLVLADICSI
jgi:hypothetical protein